MGVPWLTRHSFFSDCFDSLMEKESCEIVLRKLMARVPISGWQQLSDRTKISLKRLRKLRQGQLDHLRLSELILLSRSLQVSLSDLLAEFGVEFSSESNSSPVPSLPEFQLTAVKSIESFLTYWPAAAHQVQINPEFPARKLLPLVKPIERLLATWEVVPIDQVGAVVPFNPQQHQAITAGVSGEIDAPIQPGEMVTVRYPGYQQGEKLLWRTQVSCSRKRQI